MSNSVTVPVTNPVEQLSNLSEGDTIITEKWGDFAVIEIIQRNGGAHHFSVRGRWSNSGRYCEFSCTTLLKHGVKSIRVSV